MCHQDVNIMHPTLIAINYNLKMRNKAILSFHIFVKNDQILTHVLTRILLFVY